MPRAVRPYGLALELRLRSNFAITPLVLGIFYVQSMFRHPKDNRTRRLVDLPVQTKWRPVEVTAEDFHWGMMRSFILRKSSGIHHRPQTTAAPGVSHFGFGILGLA